LKPEVYLIRLILKNLFPNSCGNNIVCTPETNLVRFQKIIVPYYENHMKPIYTVWEKIAEISDGKLGGT
jgi:hypothetical protein